MDVALATFPGGIAVGGLASFEQLLRLAAYPPAFFTLFIGSGLAASPSAFLAKEFS